MRKTRLRFALAVETSAARLALAIGALSLLPLAVGCSAPTTTFVRSDTTTLGRVVVYRNGMAYFERYAEIDDDKLTLTVPEDKIDDFLKSLTVTDARTGEPVAIAYPGRPATANRQAGAAGDGDGAPTEVGANGGFTTMTIALAGPRPHKLRLSYVTEAPSWKPSYRVVVDDAGEGRSKVRLEGWAIVDNTSGEDWKRVRLGVGSSSAMSFRFDLRSVREVARETLPGAELFAVAPPVGGATFGGRGPADAAGSKRLLGELSDELLAQRDDERVRERSDQGYRAQGSAPPAEQAALGRATASGHVGLGRGASTGIASPRRHGDAAPAPDPPSTAATSRLATIAANARASGKPVVVEGYAAPDDADQERASLERARKVRDELLRLGVPPEKVTAVGKGARDGRPAGVQVAEGRAEDANAPDTVKDKSSGANGHDGRPADPIGTSHFESSGAMTVARGTSAMVSILNTSTDGEVVYLYDAESPRGDKTYPFRAVRMKNPTDSMLEKGPVTVFGSGRFIGEGIAEPIPARATAFVPFALDRQIVIETKGGERDAIARILSVQRGVFASEVKHTKSRTLSLYNRLPERATVFVRHTVASGYTLTSAPKEFERIGDAHLFRVDVPPSGHAEVVIEETTPVFKTLDVRTPAGMDQVRVYLSSGALEGALKGQMQKLLDLQRELANIEQRIETTREQMGEYRARMDELHAQIFTLKAVKTGGPLMRSLEKKLSEVSDKLSKATLDLVTLQESAMVHRIRFQDGVAELSLEG
jgi:hypothetical protein